MVVFVGYVIALSLSVAFGLGHEIELVLFGTAIVFALFALMGILKNQEAILSKLEALSQDGSENDTTK